MDGEDAVADGNGVDHGCPLCDLSESEVTDALKDIGEVHVMLTNLSAKMSNLDHLPTIATAVVSMNTKVTDAAIGKDQISAPMAKMIFKILATVIAALVFCIVFLLTGVKYGLIPPLH